MDGALQRFEPERIEASTHDDLRGLAQTVLDGWLDGLAPTTQKAYQGELRRFAKWWSDEVYVVEHEDLTEIAVAFLTCSKGEAYAHGQLFRRHLERERDLAPKTVRRALACLRSLVREAHRRGLVAWLFDPKIPRPRSRRDVSGPGLDVLSMLHESLLDADDLYVRRDRAILALLIDQALRRTEVSTLDLEHLDLDAEKPSVMVLRKGETERVRVELSSETVGELGAWLDQRGPEDGPLFWRGGGRGRLVPKRLSGHGIWYAVRQRSLAAGLGAVRPHGIRHDILTYLAGQDDVSLAELRDFAGHRSITTTMGYVASARERRAELSGRVAGAMRGRRQELSVEDRTPGPGRRG